MSRASPTSATCCASAGCAARRSGARSCARSEPGRGSICPPTRSTRAPRGSFPISGAGPSTPRSPSSPSAGLLAAFGTPEPVRYETNTEPHDHFRCRLCLRLFDLDTLTGHRAVDAAGLHAGAHRDARRGRLRRLRGLPARPEEGRAHDRRGRRAARSAAEGPGVPGDGRAARDAAAGREPGGPRPRSRSTTTAMRTSSGPGPPADAAARPLAGTSIGQPTRSRATCRATPPRFAVRSTGTPWRPAIAKRSRRPRTIPTASIAPTRRSAANVPPTRSA